jgi:hypothetical protein
LGSSHATDNLSFITVFAEFKQVILAFFMALFAFSNCFLVIKLDTISKIRDFRVQTVKIDTQ